MHFKQNPEPNVTNKNAIPHESQQSRPFPHTTTRTEHHSPPPRRDRISPSRLLTSPTRNLPTKVQVPNPFTKSNQKNTELATPYKPTPRRITPWATTDSKLSKPKKEHHTLPTTITDPTIQPPPGFDYPYTRSQKVTSRATPPAQQFMNDISQQLYDTIKPDQSPQDNTPNEQLQPPTHPYFTRSKTTPDIFFTDKTDTSTIPANTSEDKQTSQEPSMTLENQEIPPETNPFRTRRVSNTNKRDPKIHRKFLLSASGTLDNKFYSHRLHYNENMDKDSNYSWLDSKYPDWTQIYPRSYLHQYELWLKEWLENPSANNPIINPELKTEKPQCWYTHFRDGTPMRPHLPTTPPPNHEDFFSEEKLRNF